MNPVALAQPIKLAIIGGGPAGFYAASRLLSLVPRPAHGPDRLQVHIYDRLWAPHGLVRYGVAPDHPEVKVGYSSVALLSSRDAYHGVDREMKRERRRRVTLDITLTVENAVENAHGERA